MIEVSDWAVVGDSQKTPYTLPDKVESLEFSYDGGRVTVSVNGEEVLKTFVGHDVSVTLNNTPYCGEDQSLD